MNKRLLPLCVFLCCLQTTEAQQRNTDKHTFRPGMAMGYLPGWIQESLEDHTKSTLFMAGIYGHQQIWNESVLIMGVAYGKFDIENQEEIESILLPLKLQKFFNPERNGLNLAIGVMVTFCKNCDEQGGGALLNEINYLFDIHSLKVNVGIQPILGPVLGSAALYIGGQVQFIWSPLSKLTGNKR